MVCDVDRAMSKVTDQHRKRLAPEEVYDLLGHWSQIFVRRLRVFLHETKPSTVVAT